METRVGGLEMKADKEQQAFTNDAFISYSRKDIDFARILEKALKRICLI